MKLFILGHGTVGSGLIEILKRMDPDQIDFQIEAILVRNTAKHLSADWTDKLCDDPAFVYRSNADVLIEAMGGIEPAKSYIEHFLSRGKSVITANKALLAEHGPSLLALAEQTGASLLYEASVCGGVPIIRNLQHHRNTSSISTINGLLNGTSNYILSLLQRSDINFDQALTDAQNAGFAEADPTDDIEGIDAARKMAILAFVLTGKLHDWRSIPRKGIQTVHQQSIEAAKRQGFKLKHLSQIKMSHKGCHARLIPCCLRADQSLYAVDAEKNGVSLLSKEFGELLYVGFGAGALPTGNALFSDLTTLKLGGIKTHLLINQNTHDFLPMDDASDWLITFTTPMNLSDLNAKSLSLDTFHLKPYPNGYEVDTILKNACEEDVFALKKQLSAICPVQDFSSYPII